MTSGNTSPMFWQLRHGDKRQHISDIFSVYKNNDHIYSTPRASKYHLLHNVPKYIRIFTVPLCLLLVVLCFVYRNDDPRIGFFAISGSVPDDIAKHHSPGGKSRLVPGSSNAKTLSKSGHSTMRKNTLKIVQTNKGHDDDEYDLYSERRHGEEHMDSMLDNARVQKVLLVTYFRGGSTFLGEVFNHNRDAFYWFEPLAAPLFAYKKEHNSKDYILDEAANVLSRPTDFIESLVDILQQILDCDIENLDIRVMKHYFATNWHKSGKFFKYQTCIHKQRLRHNNNITDNAVHQCKRFLERQCYKSQVRVIKSIRMFVEEAVPLLHTDPDIKLVYYIRDPRGVLLSRWSLVNLSPSILPLERVEQTASYLCAKMRLDLDVAQKLQAVYPDRILLMRYEDLAIDPVNTVRGLYAFLGVDIPPEVVDWVQYATHAIKSDGSIGTKRENATAVASRWHETLSMDAKLAIGKHCDDVIDIFYSREFVYEDSDARR